MEDEKQIRWVGSAYDDLLAFPEDSRRGGIYRLMYVAKFEEAVYVLHCFQKKTQATSKHDKAIAGARYRAVVSVRRETK